MTMQASKLEQSAKTEFLPKEVYEKLELLAV